MGTTSWCPGGCHHPWEGPGHLRLWGPPPGRAGSKVGGARSQGFLGRAGTHRANVHVCEHECVCVCVCEHAQLPAWLRPLAALWGSGPRLQDEWLPEPLISHLGDGAGAQPALSLVPARQGLPCAALRLEPSASHLLQKVPPVPMSEPLQAWTGTATWMGTATQLQGRFPQRTLGPVQGSSRA